jgi:hypothetical protein
MIYRCALCVFFFFPWRAYGCPDQVWSALVWPVGNAFSWWSCPVPAVAPVALSAPWAAILGLWFRDAAHGACPGILRPPCLSVTENGMYYDVWLLSCCQPHHATTDGAASAMPRASTLVRLWTPLRLCCSGIHPYYIPFHWDDDGRQNISSPGRMPRPRPRPREPPILGGSRHHVHLLPSNLCKNLYHALGGQSILSYTDGGDEAVPLLVKIPQVRWLTSSWLATSSFYTLWYVQLAALPCWVSTKAFIYIFPPFTNIYDV